MATLRAGDGRASGEPIDRRLGIGIGIFQPRLVRSWRFAAVRISVPCRRGDLIELAAELSECGVLELSEKAPAELTLVQARTGHSLAGRKRRHRIPTNAAASQRLRRVASCHPCTLPRPPNRR